jgi:hypothetical protein
MGLCTTKDSPECEKNRRNSQILKSYIFRHELIRVIKFAFSLYNPMRHSSEFLQDICIFTDLTLDMLQEFTKGKVWKVKTERKVLRKKKSEESGSENEMSDEEYEVERDFQFKSELTLLVDYEVMEHYVSVLRSDKLSQNTDMMLMVHRFIKRVIYELKECFFIFCNLEFLAVFDKFLQKHKSNNPLMQGISFPSQFADPRQKRVNDMMCELLGDVVFKFMQLQRENPMIAIEALFRFSSRSQIQNAMNNYCLNEQAQPVYKFLRDSDEEEDANDKPDSDGEEEYKVRPKAEGEFAWTLEEDLSLVENYFRFRDLSKRECFEFIAQLIPDEQKTAKKCHERYKELGLKGREEVEIVASVRELHNKAQHNKKEQKISSQCRQMLEKHSSFSDFKDLERYLDSINEQLADYTKTKQDAILFGHELDLNDIKRFTDEPRSGMRLVPLTREEFRIHANVAQVGFLRQFGIRATERG